MSDWVFSAIEVAMGFPQTKEALRQAIDTQEEFLRETAGATDYETLRERGYALWEIGEELLRLHRLEEPHGLSQLKEAVASFDEAASTLWPLGAERNIAVYARWRQATTLEVLGRSREAIEVLNDLVGDIGVDWSDPEQPDLMPIVLSVWIGFQRQAGDLEAADTSADTAIERFDPGASSMERVLLGIAYRAKASAAEARGDTSAALAFLGTAIMRCSADEDTQYPDEMLSEVAQALVRRGILMEMVGHTKDATESYEEVLARCVTAVGRNPNIDWAVDTARAGMKRLRRRRWRRGFWNKRTRTPNDATL